MAGADISLIYDDCTDDSDEGFEQGDCAHGSPQEDASLPPLLRVQKYAQSGNIFDRHMVARVVQDLFRTAPENILTKELPDIMKVLTKIGDESMLRADLLEQIPHIAAQAAECSDKVSALKNVVSDYLIPLVVRNLGCQDTAVDKAAHATLVQLIEQGYITKQQAEIQVCPSILALLKVESHLDVNIAAITLMSKLAPLLGRDVTERVFLKRFSELCTSNMFYVRKVCASHFGDFCFVVGMDSILLPCYIALCNDDIWGVRKSCAEVAVFVSCACSSTTRRAVLAPVFAKLLQDECRWVMMSAFQNLGLFISTFAEPTVTSMGYNNHGKLVVFNGAGKEFVMDPPSENLPSPLKHFFVPYNNEREPNFPISSSEKQELDFVNNSILNGVDVLDIFEDEEEKPKKRPTKGLVKEEESIDVNVNYDDLLNVHGEMEEKVEVTEENIKEIVETVKNAVLTYRTEAGPEQGVIGFKKEAGKSEEAAEGLGISVEEEPIKMNEGEASRETDVKNLRELIRSIETEEKPPSQKEKTLADLIPNFGMPIKDDMEDVVVPGEEGKRQDGGDRTKLEEVEAKRQWLEGLEDKKKVKRKYGKRREGDKKDDLIRFNEYNYWYISPGVVEMGLDERLCDEEGEKSKTAAGDAVCNLEEMFSTISLNDSLEDSVLTKSIIEVNDSLRKQSIDATPQIVLEPDQDIVPQELVNHFVSMTDPNLALNVDNEITYFCAYSLPAVALTLGSDNWHLLKNTVNALAGDMQYKVRRTVASGLHELALILGPEIATEHLTPLFDGFLKDLDEVRIGVLKHLSHFLRLISPAKRASYLPRLQEFLQTDNEWNWRFRQELAKQLLLAATLFKPADAAKHVGAIAQELMCDKVDAVRQVALLLVTGLLSYISTEPGLTPSLLVKLAEKFAHSKNWKRRQTFGLLCVELLVRQALPPEQFASEVMPHLLDLSWDPVANVRLVVARCLAKHVIKNEYFSDPSNEHSDSLETVLRRLQADKDRDVRQSAEIEDQSCSLPSY